MIMLCVLSAEWVILTYTGGDKYGTHCVNDPGRRAEIMFICDPDKLEVSSNYRYLYEGSMMV